MNHLLIARYLPQHRIPSSNEREPLQLIRQLYESMSRCYLTVDGPPLPSNTWSFIAYNIRCAVATDKLTFIPVSAQRHKHHPMGPIDQLKNTKLVTRLINEGILQPFGCRLGIKAIMYNTGERSCFPFMIA